MRAILLRFDYLYAFPGGSLFQPVYMGSREGELDKADDYQHPEVQAEYDRRGRCLSSSGNPTKSSNPTTGRSTPSSGGGFCAASSHPTGAACAGVASSRARPTFIGRQALASVSSTRLFSKECYELARVRWRASSFNHVSAPREQLAASLRVQQKRAARRAHASLASCAPEHAIHSLG